VRASLAAAEKRVGDDGLAARIRSALAGDAPLGARELLALAESAYLHGHLVSAARLALAALSRDPSLEEGGRALAARILEEAATSDRVDPTSADPDTRTQWLARSRSLLK
jgi:hypothetical protein